jgi:uncharacterized protein YdcH (DUF465 family)
MATVSKKNTDTSSFEALFNRRGQLDREIEEERAAERRKVDAERVAELRKIEAQKEVERQRLEAERQRIAAEHAALRAETLIGVLEQIALYDFTLADLGLDASPPKGRVK